MEKPKDSPQGNTPAAKIAQRIADELEDELEKDKKIFRQVRQIQKILDDARATERLTREDCSSLLAQTEGIIEMPEASDCIRTIARKIAAGLRDILSYAGALPCHTRRILKRFHGYEREMEVKESFDKACTSSHYHEPTYSKNDPVSSGGGWHDEVDYDKTRVARRVYDDFLATKPLPTPPSSTSPKEYEEYAKHVRAYFAEAVKVAIQEAQKEPPEKKGFLRRWLHL